VRLNNKLVKLPNQGSGTTAMHAKRTVGSWTDRIVLSKNNVYGDADDRVIASSAHTGALAKK